MKWISEIAIDSSKVKLSLEDRIVSLGSCFSDEIAHKMLEAGFNIAINPFGTLYNPLSIANSISRLDTATPFTEAECIMMGAGAGKYCSYSHHSSFARETISQFLHNANAQLQLASEHWHYANKVIITLGSAMVWKHDGKVVSNCLKRPTAEFSHEMLSVEEIRLALENIVTSHPEKQFIFTVSPIRYLSLGAHANTISKASLHLALQPVLKHSNTDYFPAYELMMDELRDYRFYAADLVHPRDVAIDYIWTRFKGFCMIDSELAQISANEKHARSLKHISK